VIEICDQDQMKILLINNHYKIFGGSDRVFQNQMSLLKSYGHQVYYIVTDEQVSQNDGEGLILRKKRLSEQTEFEKISNVVDFFYSSKSKKKFDQFIKRVAPDVAHLHIYYGLLSNSIISSLKSAKIPLAMTMHEYRRICPAYTMIDGKGNICHRCEGRNYFSTVARKCIKGSYMLSFMASMEAFFRDRFYSLENNIATFIMVSNFIKNIHVKYVPSLENKSEVIYNFLNLKEYDPQFIRGDYFLYFGRLSSEKGLTTLIDSFEKLPELKLKIVGSGPLQNTLKRKADGLNNVSMISHTSGDELKTIVSNSSFVVVPSEWYENNPMSIIEAQALGKPVLGAKIGGIPELVINDRTGFLFESNNMVSLLDSIRKAYSIDSNKYLELSNNSRNFAIKNYDSKGYYRKIMNVYDEIITHQKTN